MIVLRAYKTELNLSERVYECEVCGLIIDRDLNAALNLERWPTASSAGRHACGEGVRPGCPADLPKQEPNLDLPRVDKFNFRRTVM
jgi:transposase